MLLGKNFDDIDASTIQSLIDTGSTESVHLEFKRESYGKSDQDKKELLKDITAFANVLGGHLIIGINEEDGAACNLSPFQKEIVDSELDRLNSIIRTGVEPTIIGLQTKHIEVDGGSVILIHVPKSYNPPHRIILKNSNRYYARNSTGVHELSLEELRMLFGEQRSIEERARTFVGERFLRIRSNDGVMSIPVSDGVLVMHLVPLPDFGASRRNELPNLRDQVEFFAPIYYGCSPRVNLEGYCFYKYNNSIFHEYTQVFRDGSLEVVSIDVFSKRGGNQYGFGSVALPKTLTSAINRYMKGLRANEASPPILLQISAMNVRGIRMFCGNNESLTCERDELHLPSSLITAFRDDNDYTNVVVEQMDFLWNAFGIERCPYGYD